MNFLFWFINVIIALILLYFKLRVSRRKLYEMTENMPGPPSWPLLGAMHIFIGKSNEDILKVVNQVLDEYSSPAKAWFGPVLAILVDSPEDLKIILNSPNCLQKAFPYDFLRVNCGLMSAPAEMWKTHRKYLNPCFNPKLLQSFLPIFNIKSKTMADRLACKLGEEPFDIYNAIGKCTLDMICGTAMGWETCDLQNSDGDLYLESAEIIAENINQRIFNVLWHPLAFYKWTKLYREEEHAWYNLRKTSKKVKEVFWKKQKQQPKNVKKIEITEDKNNNEVKEGQETSELRKPKIFVDKVFELEKNLPEFNRQCVDDELDTLIAGGNETSALSVSFCLLMLAMHQDIQERVLDELRSVFETKDQPVTPEAVSKLEYLSMVMNETLRLFPITPLIGREALKDTKLDRFEIPAGACIIMPIYKVHRNKKLWGENADLFNPDNFLPENVEKRHPYCFLPFSQGPRNCIGWRYSLLAMKTMLCHLLRNYKFTTHIKYHELKFKMCLDLKITNKHMVQIERREFK